MSAPQDTVLILAPLGQDAPAMAALLQAQGISTRICPDLADCTTQVAAGAGALLLTEESLELPQVPALFAALKAQPAWSELPLVILTHGGEHRLAALLDLVAGAATLLERPMSAATLLRAIQVALRSRQRQYQVRDLLAEQERQQEALRTSARRYQGIVETAHEGIWTIDADGRTTYVNQRMAELLGYSQEEMLGRVHTDFMWEQDRPKGDADLEKRRQGTHEVWDQRYRRKDGSELWTVASCNALFDPTGKVIGALGMFTDITERKRTEEALRLTQTSIDKAAEMVAWFRPDGSVYYVNDATCRTLGYSREELLKMNALDFSPEISHEQYEEHWREVRERKSFTLQPTHRLKDGSTYSAEVLVNHVVYGGREFIFAYGRDITKRKQAEEALREQQRLHKSVTDNAALALFIMDDRQHCVFMNPAAVQLTGYTLEETQGRPLHDVVHHTRPDGRPFPLSECAIDQAFPKNDREQGEEVFVHKDGHFYPVAFTASPLRDASGQPVGTIIEVQDITDRKRGEEALREEQRRLTLAMDAGQLVPWEIDLVTGEVKQSPRLFQIFGLDPNGAFNFRDEWRALVHEDDRHAVYQSVEAAKSGQEHHLEYRINHPDGRVHWLETHGVPVRDAQGRHVRLVGFARDITERKAFQAELERLVAERTAKLNELVAELEHFSYTITHDMRAPLRAMQGFAEMFTEAYAASQQQDAQRFLQRIRTSANRMDALITDALNYNKAVRQDLPLEPVDLGQLLRGMLDTYPELQASRAHIEIKGELPRVLANQAGLTQCFSNLLGNAVKFTRPDHKPEIRIWAETRPTPAPPRPQDSLPSRPPIVNPYPPPTSVVRIWVEDNGVGISESMLPRVFDMFTRGTNDQPGTGIGLALVRKVVDRMGGRLGVESQEGQGSRFWLELTPAT